MNIVSGISRPKQRNFNVTDSANHPVLRVVELS